MSELKNGLFRVYWRSGGSSLAAIGTKPDGSKWIAPTNWVSGSADFDWGDILEIESIEVNVCKWTRAFDLHFNISCCGDGITGTGKRANAQFKGKDKGSKWEFKFCPYCSGEIVEQLSSEESEKDE